MHKYISPPQAFTESKPTLLSRSAKKLTNEDVKKYLPK